MENFCLNSILKKDSSEDFKHENDQQNINPLISIEEKFDPKTGEVFPSKNIINSKETSKKSDKKNRDDHRHHAIDAICIAMTDRKLLQKISRDNSRGFDLDRLEIKLPNHWNSFREDAKEAIEKIVVSHKIDHGENGKLHDETYYGILKSPAKIGEDEYNVYNLIYNNIYIQIVSDSDVSQSEIIFKYIESQININDLNLIKKTLFSAFD